MKESSIYSIGHGRKSTEKLIEELRQFNIHYLLDIRSKPYSQWSPQFNREDFKLELETNNINYVFIGDSLGGLPQDTSCYDRDGKVIYDRLKEKDFFKKGLERLITANEKSVKIAIMCSESNPGECHRSKLIGQELLKHGISLNHIVSGFKIKSQIDVMNELLGNNAKDLFGNATKFTSRKSY